MNERAGQIFITFEQQKKKKSKSSEGKSRDYKKRSSSGTVNDNQWNKYKKRVLESIRVKMRVWWKKKGKICAHTHCMWMCSSLAGGKKSRTHTHTRTHIFLLIFVSISGWCLLAFQRLPFLSFLSILQLCMPFSKQHIHLHS